jgi:hypothetical protein
MRATTNGGPPPSPAATPASFRSPPLYSPRGALDRDGSLDLSLRRESPGKAEETDRLPAPAVEFISMPRPYWPRETTAAILDGTRKALR